MQIHGPSGKNRCSEPKAVKAANRAESFIESEILFDPFDSLSFAGPMKALEFLAGLGSGMRFALVFHQVPKKEGGAY
jgi:hypothetical protein